MLRAELERGALFGQSRDRFQIAGERSDDRHRNPIAVLLLLADDPMGGAGGEHGLHRDHVVSVPGSASLALRGVVPRFPGVRAGVVREQVRGFTFIAIHHPAQHGHGRRGLSGLIALKGAGRTGYLFSGLLLRETGPAPRLLKGVVSVSSSNSLIFVLFFSSIIPPYVFAGFGLL